MTAIMSAVANDVWPIVRDKFSRVLSPVNPAVEGATLEEILTTNVDEQQQEAALKNHLDSWLQEHPQLAELLEVAIREADRITAAGPGGVGAETLLAMDASWAAQVLEKMPDDVAIARLWIMRRDQQTEAAVRRLTFMDPSRAAELLSIMDVTLAADFLAAMTPPHPAALFVRINQDRCAAILAAMGPPQSVTRMTEITQTDSARAALVLFEMDKTNRVSAARLLAAMDTSHTTEVFKQMSPDRASAMLAAMDTESAARHLAKMGLERAALLLSKVDKGSAKALLHAVAEPLSAELLARMAIPDAAEVLAIMDPAWVRGRLANIRPASRAVDLLVALRPPRTLLDEIDGTLASELLREAVTTLASLGEKRALYESALEEAVKIRAEADEYARKTRQEAEAERDRARAEADKLPNKPPKPAPPTLAERIIQHLQEHGSGGQTLQELVNALDESEEMVSRELRSMIDDNRVRLDRPSRLAPPHYIAGRRKS